MIKYIKKLKKLIFGDPESYENIMAKRSELKDQVMESLRELNFTTMECKEVLLIVAEAERKIEILKAKIAAKQVVVFKTGTESEVKNPAPYVAGIHEQIEKEVKLMREKMNEKIDQIIERKKR
ncbi:MAG: hypothetical protein A2Y25_05590 [Candidatus Melainabacteria bacterium GWF2_37_15]|nr:MAG: hypothetical protein A2Y25_05590 [Candidatus Melainabacteria bacterium GWF2_37_15]